jgi:hypothetical protein
MADLDALLEPETDPPGPRDKAMVIGILCVGPSRTPEELQDLYAPNWREGGDDWRSPWAINPELAVIEFVDEESGVSTFLGWKS